MDMKPMLAANIDSKRLEEKCSDYLMEPKLDGVRCVAKVEDGRVEMYTRTGHTLHDKLPHLVAQLSDLGDIVLDGEIGYLNGPYQMDFNKTMRVLGSARETAIAKQADDAPIAFKVFDMPKMGGVSYLDCPQEDRSYVVDGVLKIMEFPDIDSVVPLAWGWTEEAYNNIVDQGAEGVIMKNPQGLYKPGKRPPQTWYKVKKFDTIDVVITGYQMGQGKFSHMVGAIEFGLPVGSSRSDERPAYVPLGKCSGMTDDIRQDITANMLKYLGKVIEIRHFGRVGKEGAGLRHPQFVRFRPDKVTP